MHTDSALRSSPPGGAEFVRQAQAALAPLADADKARAMGAYLRGQFVFLGVPTPARRAAVAALIKPRFGQDALLSIADALWQLPYREYRYVAIDLLARHVKAFNVDVLAPLLGLAQREPWWESVDGLAAVVGDVVRQEMARGPGAQLAMDAALKHPSMWVRRMAMTHQLGWRMQTDAARLFSYAAALAPEEDFFIRKAIGWALRDYARWYPAAVRGFLDAHGARLSALTVREAGKHLRARYADLSPV